MFDVYHEIIIFQRYGEQHVGPISTKNGKVLVVDDVIIPYNFDWNILGFSDLQESNFPFSR